MLTHAPVITSHCCRLSDLKTIDYSNWCVIYRHRVENLNPKGNDRRDSVGCSNCTVKRASRNMSLCQVNECLEHHVRCGKCAAENVCDDEAKWPHRGVLFMVLAEIFFPLAIHYFFLVIGSMRKIGSFCVSSRSMLVSWSWDRPHFQVLTEKAASCLSARMINFQDMLFTDAWHTSVVIIQTWSIYMVICICRWSSVCPEFQGTPFPNTMPWRLWSFWNAVFSGWPRRAILNYRPVQSKNRPDQTKKLKGEYVASSRGG